MASRARILGATILAAVLVVVAGAVLRGRGEGEGGPRDVAATSSVAAGDGASRSAKHAGASQSRRVDRAAFVDAGAASSSDEAGAPPIPAHLRRVVVRLVFDDGHPLADVLVAAEAAKPDATDVPDAAASPEANDADAWSEDGGAVVHARTDADGRAAFRVPHGARFALTGGGGSSHAPFRSSVVRADAGDVVATVAARPARVTVVDESGAPVARLTIQAIGSAPFGDGRAWQVTDADGRAVFRGFQGRVQLSLDPQDGAVAAYFVRRPAAEEEDEDQRIFAATDTETRLVVRRLTAATARIVDRFGDAVGGAAALLDAEYAGGFRLRIGSAFAESDGRVRCVVPTDGDRLAADLSPATLRLEVWTPGVATPTVVSRPIVRLGVDCDFGDVAVPVASRVKFRVVDEHGAPVVGATVGALSDLPADAPLSTPIGETDATGTAVLFEPATEASFAVNRGETRRVVRATDEARRLDGPGQTVAMPAVSDLLLFLPPAGTRPGDTIAYEANWRDDATGEARGVRGSLANGGHALLSGLVVGTNVSVVLSDCAGRYGELAGVAPPAGETRRMRVPPPPPNALRVRVVDADGTPVSGFGLIVQDGDGGALAEAPPEDGRAEWSTSCVGVRSGEIVVWVDVRGVATEKRATLTPPSTDVVVRVAPTRTVRLVVRGSSSAWSDIDSVAVYVETGPIRRLVNGSHDGRVGAFSTQVPGDEAVRFRVVYAGGNFEVDAPANRDEVELALPDAGTIVVVAARRPAAAFLAVEIAPFGERSVPVRTMSFLAPSDSPWRIGPLLVRPGRCSVTADLSFGGYPGVGSVDLGVREVTVVAGKETVVEF